MLPTTFLRMSAAALALQALTTCSLLYAQQVDATHPPGNSRTHASDSSLAEELQSLRHKVRALEDALDSQHRTRYGSASQTTPLPSSDTQATAMRMGMMRGMGGMQGMSQDSDSSTSEMGTMGGGMGMGMMPSMRGKKSMMGMGMGMMGMNPAMSSDSMAGMNMPSALPGFPGASHLYHIGETGFFLDHPEHIALTDEQLKKLNTIKESSLLATSTAQREIAEAEQELWTLTAADEPDIKKIEAKAKEIAQLQVKNRIAFIRSVGEAASVLTNEQREALVGEGKK